ncbi:TetR/AcrR family transcriptional regulator [Niveispirillum sp.]|uniref:TetR/AcrR family transcriptional regulator n=1 Tax=Niveispirillum sp. TaxID=1917217 RepID=UPI001B4F4705|nr:TetR/AcrR family transcriptional regulator [Niveispirillum sp.]MBP7335575.1 TetR/AcrR family transcriptional regulator [Niveispirillum sp.]
MSTEPETPATKPVRRRQQQRAIDTRERIVEAAIAEFSARGFEAASTRAMADAADAKHTLVTYHFNGKEGLWQAAMDRTVKAFTTKQSERLAGLHGVDDVIKLRLVLEDFVRYSAGNLHLHRLMTHLSSGASPQLDALVTDYLKGYFDLVADLIRSCQAKGQFVEGDPHHLHYLFIGAATRIFMQSVEATRIIGRSPLDPGFIDMHVDRCLALFFRDPPKKRDRQGS